MDRKLRNLTGILAISALRLFGSETNSIPVQTGVSLSYIYKTIPRFSQSSCEKAITSANTLFTDASIMVNSSYSYCVSEGKVISEKLVDKVSDVLNTAISVSLELFTDDKGLRVYYLKEF